MDILLQFLIEAIIVSLTGGVIGTFIGAGATLLFYDQATGKSQQHKLSGGKISQAGNG